MHKTASWKIAAKISVALSLNYYSLENKFNFIIELTHFFTWLNLALHPELCASFIMEHWLGICAIAIQSPHLIRIACGFYAYRKISFGWHTWALF